MSSLYVTTSRKPSQLTRRLARWLALLLSATTENRGKRSVAEVVDRAKSFGCSRIAFVHESRGNPSKLSFYDSREGWLEPEVFVQGADIPAKEKVRVPRDVAVVGQKKAAETIKNLLNLEEPETEDAVEAHVEENRLWFEYEGKKLGPALKISFSSPK